MLAIILILIDIVYKPVDIQSLQKFTYSTYVIPADITTRIIKNLNSK